MKKIVLFILLAVAAAVSCQNRSKETVAHIETIESSSIDMLCLEAETDMTQQAKVHICTGGSSKRYHSTSKCSGLRNCSGAIKEISADAAERMGRTPCKICCY